MKSTIGLMAAFLLFYIYVYVNAQAAGNNEAPEAAKCADRKKAVLLLRALNPSAGDHFYTTNATEMDIATRTLGYVAEGNAGFIFKDHIERSVPLYRLHNLTTIDHFYTASAKERDSVGGYVYEGIAGYVYPEQLCGSVALLRGWSAQGTDHFYTTSDVEMENAILHVGYVSEGTTGYVLPG
ncbi:hypothetical protein EWM64_g8664 [Hericium alpestre]|uniref:DUF5648 domain-containing protein n=1 Tax=Hericium alpestre TaxID=135208 RepID=A0A4Y9ZM68_9AGAM|nr:hypothetical protein EWM64_g8664 [Hericium alpestre]